MDASLLIGCVHGVFPRQHTLDDYVENARPKQIHVDVDLLQMLAKGRQRPLKSEVIVFEVVCLHIVLALLVDGIVCQMNELVSLCRRSVLLGGKSGEPLFENVNA